VKECTTVCDKCQKGVYTPTLGSNLYDLLACKHCRIMRAASEHLNAFIAIRSVEELIEKQHAAMALLHEEETLNNEVASAEARLGIL
jgi:acetyl-CoA carboxylase beta subunit